MTGAENAAPGKNGRMEHGALRTGSFPAGKRDVGVYIHIPFCVHKCAYCDFPSWAGREDYMAAYTDALCREIGARVPRDARADTVYIGGGTPSVLPAALMERVIGTLRAHMDIAPDAEMSCEMNPGTVTEDFAACMRQGGFDRVSMGMQAAQNRLLRALDRVHTAADVAASADILRRVGFENLNLEDKCTVLSEILHLFQCQSAAANLKLIGGPASAGILVMNNNITKCKQISIINQSVTGIYKKEIDLLKL